VIIVTVTVVKPDVVREPAGIVKTPLVDPAVIVAVAPVAAFAPDRL
jgi:hypothetical protein